VLLAAQHTDDALQTALTKALLIATAIASYRRLYNTERLRRGPYCRT
jgi:hypothetical protein